MALSLVAAVLAAVPPHWMERRIVEADACAGLLDATAVVIAVAMDPALVVRRVVDTNGARTPSVDAQRDPCPADPTPPPGSGPGYRSVCDLMND